MEFRSSCFPCGTFILFVTHKQEDEQGEDDEDGADSTPKRGPVELQPGSSRGLIDVLIII